MLLVTGATGFIGSAVVRRLARRDREVVAAYHHTPYARSIREDVTPVRLDIAGRADFDALGSSDISAVIHLAASVPSMNETRSSRYLRDNVTGTSNVVDYCRRQGIGTLVFASSISVYGGDGVLCEDDAPAPSDDYGLSKLEGEETCLSFARETGARVVVLRLSAVYGPEMRTTYVLPLFVEKALRGEDLVVYGGGKSAMDYLHVDDAARAFEIALDGDASGTFNICSGETTSVGELAERVRETFGDGSTRILHDASKDCAGREMRPSSEKASRELGFAAAIPLGEGLSKWKESINVPSPVSGEGL
jgi:nucleoside-diphosphate-sugar epimerase